MAKPSKAVINRLSALMSQARKSHSNQDLRALYEFAKNFVECYGDEPLYMNFSNPELTILDEAQKTMRALGIR